MKIPRMRTISESLEVIKKADPATSVTANCIRSLCKNRTIRCVYTGTKILVNMDDLLALLGVDDGDQQEPEKQDSKVDERKQLADLLSKLLVGTEA